MVENGATRRVAADPSNARRADRSCDDARQVRQREELREIARRDSFRRALLGTNRDTKDRRADLAATLKRAVDQEEVERVAPIDGGNPIVATEPIAAEEQDGDAERGEVESDGEGAVAAEASATGSAELPVDSTRGASSGPLIECKTAAGSSGHSHPQGDGRPGSRAFEFAERFRAFGELRRSATGALEVEILMPTTNAGPSSLSIVTVAPRRVMLRFKGDPTAARAVRELVVELRDAGLEVVKPVEASSPGSES